MRPLAAAEIFGNWATLLLPIDEQDDIDFDSLGAQIDATIAAGVNGVYSNGTAGEFHTQTEDEFDNINELLALQRAREQAVLVSCTSNLRQLTLAAVGGNDLH